MFRNSFFFNTYMLSIIIWSMHFHCLSFQIPIPPVDFVALINNAQKVNILEYANTEDVHVLKDSHLLVSRVKKIIWSYFLNKNNYYFISYWLCTFWVRDHWYAHMSNLQHCIYCPLNCDIKTKNNTHILYTCIINIGFSLWIGMRSTESYNVFTFFMNHFTKHLSQKLVIHLKITHS